MNNNTRTPPPTGPHPCQGFILDDGPCCHRCIDRTKENIYTLPWLFEGEHYNCIRCRGKFINVE